MRDTIIVMLLVVLIGIHTWGMMQEDRLRDQVASLQEQQMAVQAQHLLTGLEELSNNGAHCNTCGGPEKARELLAIARARGEKGEQE